MRILSTCLYRSFPLQTQNYQEWDYIFSMGTGSFSSELIKWQKKHGRRELPWQNNRSPYIVWLSEIMLQQTQVETVIPYFRRFVKRFPTLTVLARARITTVLSCWSGLGYYSRARNLHTAAKKILVDFKGQFPHDRQLLQALPGVGRSTAGAIAVFAFGKREAILDGNVKRVLTRYFGIAGYLENPLVKARLWSLAEGLLPRRNIETYSQALMDLGALVCGRSDPLCDACPVNASCFAFQKGKTSLLPEKKKRDPLPRRKVWMAIIVKDGCILLQRRPSLGIWGGLWSLPETKSLEEIPRLVEKLAGSHGFSQSPLTPIKHAFTHFRLTIYPEICLIDSPKQSGLPHSRQSHWLNSKEPLSRFGLPAPVRKILVLAREKNRQERRKYQKKSQWIKPARKNTHEKAYPIFSFPLHPGSQTDKRCPGTGPIRGHGRLDKHCSQRVSLHHQAEHRPVH